MSENHRSKFPVKTPQEYLLEEEELSSNSEPRVPIIVCVDCSFSMRQQHRLERVLEGLEDFCADMAADPIACQSVELCIVSFGGEQAVVERDSPRRTGCSCPSSPPAGKPPWLTAS